MLQPPPHAHFIRKAVLISKISRMPKDVQDLKNELHRVTTTTLVYKPNSTKISLGEPNFTYLITKRAMHKLVMPGKWTIPGGGLHVSDYINTPPTTKAKQWYGALEKSLRREIKEEVGLEIGKPEFLTDLTFIRPDGVPVICFSYFATFVGGEVKLDADTTDYAWVDLEEAKKYDLIDGIWEEIEMVDKI